MKTRLHFLRAKAATAISAS